MVSTNEDMISKLPDPLICDILSRLPTKDSIETMFLSTRWRNIWKSVPGLDLDSRNFSNLDAFVNYTDKFFDMQKDLCMLKLCLKIKDPNENPNGKAFLLPWVNDALTNRKIQHLDLGIFGIFKFDEIPPIPLSLYTCDTLVHLDLHQLVLADADVFHLPCLKVIQLFYIRYRNESTLEKLISASPVLEDLWMMTSSSQKEKVLQVRSRTLKRIAIDHQDTLVVIDAPLLQRLRTRFGSTKNYEMIGSFPAKLDIHFGSMRNGLDENKLVVSDIFTEISEVTDLTIATYDWKHIFPYPGPLIQFCNLSRLRATFPGADLEVLPNLLESCPKLEHFILELYDQPKIMFSTVHPCMVTSLKSVEYISYVEEYSEGELNLVRYFLKNSTILEKFSIRFSRINTSHDILKEQIVAMPRCSASCQLVVL